MANTNKLIDIDRLSEYNDKIQEQIKNAGGEKDFTIEFSEYLSQYTYTVFDSSTEVYKTCQEIMNYRKETGKNPKIYVKWLQDYNTNEAIYEVFDIYISNKNFRFTTNKSSVPSDEGIYSQFISIEAAANNYIITSSVYIRLGFAAREAFLYDTNAMYNQKQKQSSALGLENTARYTPTSDYHPATKKYVDDNIVKTQYSTIPTADSTTVGKIIQYVGETTEEYTNGYFYIGTEATEEETTTYSWKNIEVSPESQSAKFYQVKMTDLVTNYDGALSDYGKTFFAKIDEDFESGVISFVKFTDYFTINKPVTIPFCFYSDKAYGGLFLKSITTFQNTAFNGWSYYTTNNVSRNLFQNLIITLSVTKNSLNYDETRFMDTYKYLCSFPYQINDYQLCSLTINNTKEFTPEGDYNPSTKLYTDKTHYENMTGYDATKTQVLKNINGTLTWVDEE